MKFKIYKDQWERMRGMFGNGKYYEIELEPVMDTASEAIMRQQLDQVAYDKGFKYGYAQGFHDGRRPEYVMGYDLGSRDKDTVVIAKKKPDGSIEILNTL